MTNLELVQTAVFAAATGDLATAREHVADDFVWHIPGTSPVSGDFKGVEGWAAHLARLFAAGLKPEIIAWLEGAEHVVAVQRNVAENNGNRLDVPVIALYTVRDGKVQRMDSFFGDQVAAEQFWSAAKIPS